MRNVVCNLPESAVIEIAFGTFRRELSRGSVVDLDQIVGTTKEVKNATGDIVEAPRTLTVADLLEGRLECFSPEGEAHDQGPAEPAADEDVHE